MQFSIILPCYNESKNIKKLIIEIEQNLKGYNYEIIFIDDKSNDNSIEIVRKLKNNKIILEVNKKNLGQSHCIHRGVKIAKSNTIVTMDCDGQNNPKDILKLYKLYNDNDDIYLVGGIRSNRKDNLIKIYSSKIANNIRNFILKDNCSDTGCSLKVFDRQSFLQFPLFSGLHRFLPALFLGLNKKTLFVSVDHRKRLYGISKYGTFNRAFNGVKDLFFVYRIINQMKKNV